MRLWPSRTLGITCCLLCSSIGLQRGSEGAGADIHHSLPPAASNLQSDSGIEWTLIRVESGLLWDTSGLCQSA